MNRASMVLLCMLSLAPLYAQSSAPGKLRFDLSRIGFVLDGQQICEDKGRLQDYPSPVMDQIIAGGAKFYPRLDRHAHGRSDGKDERADYLLLAGNGNRGYRLLH